MIGVTIGAGIGRLEGTYGLLQDALTSARLVTANGSIVNVSAEENSELFVSIQFSLFSQHQQYHLREQILTITNGQWGIRGAGANFGIITQATYGIHSNPIQNNFTNVDVVFPAEKNISYFGMLESVVADSNRSAALSIDSAIIYNTTTNQLEIEANWVYYGPRDEALEVMTPMLALDPPVIEISEVRWEVLNEVAGFGSDAATCAPGQNTDIYSANLLTLNATTLESTFSKMSTFYALNPEARGSSVLLETFPNQAANAINHNATAFPWRDTKTYVYVYSLILPSSQRLLYVALGHAANYGSLMIGSCNSPGMRRAVPPMIRKWRPTTWASSSAATSPLHPAMPTASPSTPTMRMGMRP